MKLYLQGPITGFEDTYKKNFAEAAEKLRAAGYEVVNPAELDESEGVRRTKREYMRRDLKIIINDEAILGIAQLPGSDNSMGSFQEAVVGEAVEILVLPVDYWLRYKIEARPEHFLEKGR